MNVENCIFELLYKHNCVILPGIGGFVCNIQNGMFSTSSSITPLSKSIGFNKNLTINDGLVYNFIANKYDLTYAEAEQQYKAFQDRVRTTLSNNQTFLFPKIGKINMDLENNLQFYPTNSENYNLSAFGLKKINIHPINRSTMSEETTPITEQVINTYETVENTVTHTVSTPVDHIIEPAKDYTYQYTNEERELTEDEQEELDARKRTTWYRRIAALLFICLLGGLMYNFMSSSNNTAEGQQSSGFFSSIKNLFASKPAVVDSALIENTETTATVDGVKPLPTSGDVDLVFGSFKQDKNAKKLLKKLQNEGISASLVTGDNGYKRVMIKVDVSKIEGLKSSYPQSWVL
jgi:hypothetical protein